MTKTAQPKPAWTRPVQLNNEPRIELTVFTVKSYFNYEDAEAIAHEMLAHCRTHANSK